MNIVFIKNTFLVILILALPLIGFGTPKQKEILDNNRSSLMNISYFFLADIPLPDECSWVKVENRERPSIISLGVMLKVKLFII